MKNKILFFLAVHIIPFLCMAFNPASIIKRQKAVNAYRSNDYQKAEELFQELLLNNYQDYETIYNLGKVSYAKKDFKQAESYFDQVSKIDTLAKERRIEAFFDKGNAQVQQKKLEDALKSYQDVVNLDADHKQAQEMIEAIKKLLEQQKQKQEQQKNNQQNNNNNEQEQKKQQQQNSEDKSQEQKSDKSEQESDEESQQNTNQQEDQEKKQGSNRDNNQDKQSKEKEEQSKNQQESQQKDERPENPQEQKQDNKQGSDSSEKPKNRDDQQSNADQKGDKLEKKDQGNQEQQRGEKNNQEATNKDSQGPLGNQRNDIMDGDESKKNEQEERNEQQQHKNSPSPKSGQPHADDTKDGSKKQMPVLSDEKEEQDFPDERLDEQEALLLKLLEDKDAKTLKQLLKGTVKKNMPEQYGQKNW